MPLKRQSGGAKASDPDHFNTTIALSNIPTRAGVDFDKTTGEDKFDEFLLEAGKWAKNEMKIGTAGVDVFALLYHHRVQIVADGKGNIALRVNANVDDIEIADEDGVHKLGEYFED